MTTAIHISNGLLVDGSGAAPVPNIDVVVDGDVIVAVGATGTIDDRVPAGALVIDADGATIMPGLIDAHCHITFDDVQSNDELFFHRPPTTAAMMTLFNLPKLLLSGVTSIMDPDTVMGIGPEVREAVKSGAFPGPRIATGVQALLTSVGGTAGRLIPNEGRVGYAAIVNTIDEMVIETRRQIKDGADWIKIHATGSIPTHQGELQVWTLDEMKAVCATSHALGVPVVAHCRNSSSTLEAAQAGVDLILHASFIDDDGLQAVIDNGAALCPTFTFLANLADHGELVGAGGMREVFRGEIEATADMIRKAYDAGVPILCGSESGFALTPYGHWHAREMEVFVNELGLTPVEAMTCATKNNAFAMRLSGKLGVIAEGYLADVLVVDGDPASDVTVLQDRTNLRTVISRGAPVDLTAPWPERRRIPGEKVGNWADQVLTYERTRQIN
ncbi:amidohydrolase family protein [Ilumatobacter sp.]|uniref:metal-dependent hydrolase family protein n=1 Tax=Ilumatobacter sp. TaxID=1967498 RepID=UPI003750EBA0